MEHFFAWNTSCYYRLLLYCILISICCPTKLTLCACAVGMSQKPDWVNVIFSKLFSRSEGADVTRFVEKEVELNLALRRRSTVRRLTLEPHSIQLISFLQKQAYNMDVRTGGGTVGTCLPLFTNLYAKCPFSPYIVPFLTREDPQDCMCPPPLFEYFIRPLFIRILRLIIAEI